MTAEATTLIAANGVEPTYSAREASALLGRSHSWLDQVACSHWMSSNQF